MWQEALAEQLTGRAVYFCSLVQVYSQPWWLEKLSCLHCGLCTSWWIKKQRELGPEVKFDCIPKPVQPACLYVPKTDPPSGDRVFKHTSLLGTCHIQTITHSSDPSSSSLPELLYHSIRHKPPHLQRDFITLLAFQGYCVWWLNERESFSRAV